MPDSPTTSTQSPAKHWIAGYWHRLGAFAADTLILGFIGFFLGAIFKGYFVELGEWGRLLGFGIALAYFGTMNSKICGGQTIGKRILGLRVVDSLNQTVGVFRAIGRTAVWGVPFYFNGLQFEPEFATSYAAYALSALLLGGILAILYLYTFNLRTRQSLHDLSAHTFVVHVAHAPTTPRRIWLGHFAIVALLVLVSAAAPKIAEPYAPTSSNDNTILATQAALEVPPHVREARIETISEQTDLGSTSEVVRVEVFVTHPSAGEEEFARNLLSILLQHSPTVSDASRISIVLAIGYDIGIWSQWTSETYHFTPEDYALSVQPIDKK